MFGVPYLKKRALPPGSKHNDEQRVHRAMRYEELRGEYNNIIKDIKLRKGRVELNYAMLQIYTHIYIYTHYALCSKSLCKMTPGD